MPLNRRRGAGYLWLPLAMWVLTCGGCIHFGADNLVYLTDAGAPTISAEATRTIGISAATWGSCDSGTAIHAVCNDPREHETYLATPWNKCRCIMIDEMAVELSPDGRSGRFILITEPFMHWPLAEKAASMVLRGGGPVTWESADGKRGRLTFTNIMLTPDHLPDRSVKVAGHMDSQRHDAGTCDNMRVMLQKHPTVK